MYISIIGPSPKHLPGGYNMASKENKIIVNSIEKHLISMMNSGEKVAVLTDLSLGLSTFIATIALNLREKNYPISLHIVIPNMDQDGRWYPRDRAKYRDILSKSDTVKHISKASYTLDSIQKTHRYLDKTSNKILFLDSGRLDATSKIRLKSVRNKIISL